MSLVEFAGIKEAAIAVIKTELSANITKKKKKKDIKQIS